MGRSSSCSTSPASSEISPCPGRTARRPPRRPRISIRRTLALTGARPIAEGFFLRPYLSVLTGLTLLLLAVGVLLAVRRRRRVLALCLAVAIPLVYLGEFEFNLPVVSWLGGRTGQNITASFGPATAERTLVLAAHYDTKTELFDHVQRKPIYAAAPLAMAALLLAGLLSLLGRGIRSFDCGLPRRLAMVLSGLGVAGLFLLTLSFGGGYFLREKSPGVRDDGTSVAILLGLADRLGRGSVDPGNLRVRLVFFAGEEANMQGSQAYVARHRAELGRAVLIDLEGLAGAGLYRYYERTGTFLRKYPSSDRLQALLDSALAQQGLAPSVAGGSVFDDSASFAATGVPVLTIYNEALGRTDSYHNAGDALDRVVPGRMEEITAILGGR